MAECWSVEEFSRASDVRLIFSAADLIILLIQFVLHLKFCLG